MPLVTLRREKKAVGVIKLSDYDNRRAVPNAEYYRILVDCRDLTAHRLLVSFTSMMDRLADGLLAKANDCGILAETNLLLETRSIVQANRAYLVSAFEKGVREQIDRRLRGEVERPRAAERPEEQQLALVEDAEVEEVIATDNFTRTLANTCHDQVMPLNARIGFLLGERLLETPDNPFGPHALARAFRDAWTGVDIKAEGKVTVLKMMDGGVVGDVNSVYADLNRHLANLNVLPNLTQGNQARTTGAKRAGGGSGSSDGDHGKHGGGDRSGDSDDAAAGADGKAKRRFSRQDGDLFGLLRDLFVRIQQSGRGNASPPVAAGNVNPYLNPPPGGGYPMAPWATSVQMSTAVGPGTGGGDVAQNPWSSFGVGTPPAAGTGFGGGKGGGGDGDGGDGVDPGVIASLTRLQQGLASGPPTGDIAQYGPAVMVDYNALRRLTPTDLGSSVDANGAMTIELVAMLFDFVSADRQLPDAIKALLFRLQIPVLKAAMLDKEFFSRRTHPARLLVNRYAEAGIAWHVEDGTADPLFVKIRDGVARIQNEFTDQLDLFPEVLKDLEAYLLEEEKSAEQVVQASADDIASGERREVAQLVSSAELERRINSSQPPDFLAGFLRNPWRNVLVAAYLAEGEEGAEWRTVLADMDNLLWSVQPKRTGDERRELVKRLPELLSRLQARVKTVEWEPASREQFMSDLVECHARAVTATNATAVVATATPVPLSGALAEGDASVVDSADRDQYHELAESMARGMWVEFTEESGVLVFAKLSWVSPLRGKYLFTHRNGLKAFSLTREELAQRFRDDSAQPVEAEPLLDRAFSDVMSRLSAQAGV